MVPPAAEAQELGNYLITEHFSGELFYQDGCNRDRSLSCDATGRQILRGPGDICSGNGTCGGKTLSLSPEILLGNGEPESGENLKAIQEPLAPRVVSVDFS